MYELFEVTVFASEGTATCVVSALDSVDADRQARAWSPFKVSDATVTPLRAPKNRGVLVGLVSYTVTCDACNGTGNGAAPVVLTAKDPKRPVADRPKIRRTRRK